MNPVVQNMGRQFIFISGIQGVGTNAQATINMPVNLRAHRLNFQCSGVAYQQPTASLQAGDLGTGSITLTVINGVVVVATPGGTLNSTRGAGTYPLTIIDSLYVLANGITVRVGQGATGTYTVNGANQITAAAITNGGVPGPVPPELFFTSFKQLVNGITFRDVNPIEIVRMYLANPMFDQQRLGYALGEFNVFFTEPWRNLNHHNEMTSWDLFGQNSWQIQCAIGGVGSPVLVGAYEFDAQRNVVPGSVTAQNPNGTPFLQPIAQHQFSLNEGAGRTDWTTLPFGFPIIRMWFYATNSLTGARFGAGSITQTEIYQDGNKIVEATAAQLNQLYNHYGFDTSIYDSAFISDVDQRMWEALKCAKSLIVRTYNAQAQTINCVMETLPGAYQ